MITAPLVRTLLANYQYAAKKKLFPFHVSENIVELEEALIKQDKKIKAIQKSYGMLGEDGNPVEFFLYEAVVDQLTGKEKHLPVVTEFKYKVDKKVPTPIEELKALPEFAGKKIYYGLADPKIYEAFAKDYEELEKQSFSFNGFSYLEEGEVVPTTNIDIKLNKLSVAAIQTAESQGKLDDENIINLLRMMKKFKISYDPNAKEETASETPVVPMNAALPKAVKETKPPKPKK